MRFVNNSTLNKVGLDKRWDYNLITCLIRIKTASKRKIFRLTLELFLDVSSCPPTHSLPISYSISRISLSILHNWYRGKSILFTFKICLESHVQLSDCVITVLMKNKLSTWTNIIKTSVMGVKTTKKNHIYKNKSHGS